MAEKPNFLNAVLQGLGLGKEPPKQPPAKPALTGNLAGRATAPLNGPFTKAEQQQDSKDRRFLIAAYQTKPNLIPAFSDAQYMYKLISEECEYLRVSIEEKEAERKQLEEKSKTGTLSPREQWRLKAVETELPAHREEHNRFMPLLKKVIEKPLSASGEDEKSEKEVSADP